MTPALAIYLSIGCLLMLAFERAGVVSEAYARRLKESRHSIRHIRMGAVAGFVGLIVLWPLVVVVLVVAVWRELRGAA